MSFARVMGLWARPSRTTEGATILVGRLGDLRIVIAPNGDAAGGEPTHLVWVAPVEHAASAERAAPASAPDGRDHPAPAPAKRRRKRGAPTRRRAPYAHLRRDEPALHDGAELNDPIPDLAPDEPTGDGTTNSGSTIG